MPELSGRDLDATVARIIGWSEIHIHKCRNSHCWGEGCLGEKWVGMPPGEQLRELPPFSADIAWAMRAAETLCRRRGLWLKLQSPWFPNDPSDEHPWHAGFSEQGTTGWNGRPEYRGASDRGAAEAICRAIVEAGENNS